MQTKTRAAIVLAMISLLATACTEGETKTHKLYFLGGQSNMVGYGYVSELPVDLSHGVDRVMIFAGRPAYDGERQGGKGLWSPLRPGFGHGFETDGRNIVLSDRFGPELSFGIELSSNQPNTSIALVKYAFGGSGLAPGVGEGNWHPTIRNGHRVNQFDHAIRTLENALSDRDIDGDGIRDRLVPAGIYAASVSVAMALSTCPFSLDQTVCPSYSTNPGLPESRSGIREPCSRSPSPTVKIRVPFSA